MADSEEPARRSLSDHRAPSFVATAQQAAYELQLGWDPTTLLHELRLRQDSIFSVAGGSTTSRQDIHELIEAARAELRKVQPGKERAELAGRMLEQAEGEEDALNFAERMAQLMREAGVLPPELTLEYRDLCVEADALVGSAGIPSMGNSFKQMLKRATCQGGLETRPFKILKGVSGVLRPGTVTLLLGPPGAGKTVFLETLSGRLAGGKNVRISGMRKYNGVDASEFVLRRTVALVGQMDYHIPSLTVLETCDFAHACQASLETAAHFMAKLDQLSERLEREAALEELGAEEDRAEMGQAGLGKGEDEDEAVDKPPASSRGAHGALADPQFVKQFRELVKRRAKPNLILKLLGLTEVADTIVGDAMTRGISGGQRKRVTTAEVLCGPQSVVLMDEISTGLDSATTYSVVKTFYNSTHALGKTMVISLLQPPPEVVQLFDDILLLTDGRVVYHGPVGEILPFFERQLDFVCPMRKDAGSFLQEVTTPLGQYAYASPALLARKGLSEADREPARLLTAPPQAMLTPVEEMEAVFWKETQWGRGMLEALDQHPFDPADGQPDVLFKSTYSNGVMHLTRLVLARQFVLNGRDRTFYIARAVQAIVLGLIVGSLFAPIDHSVAGGRQVMALASLSAQAMAQMSMPQIGLVFANKRVFYKQRDNHFFPPASYVVSFVLTQLPASTVECTVYSLLVYWITGLCPNAGNFFSWLAVVWSVSNCMAGFYRLLAYCVPSMVVANAAGGLALLFLMITNGFSIVRGSIPDWLIWVYWMNPLSWAVRAIVANELGSPAWDVPMSPGSTITMGEEAAAEFDFYLGSKWIWGSVGLSWGILVLFTAAGALALKITQPASPRPTVSEEEQKEEVERSVLSTLSRLSHQPHPERSASAGSAGAAPPVDEPVPFVPITLVCKDIRYFVNDPSQGKAPGVVKGGADREIEGKLELLKGINIYAEPGSLTALMGGSGAGKTTLMDVILGRKTVGIIRGDILVNGHPKVQGTWSRVCGYVEQQDVHSAGTTVREALLFSARLRLEESIGLPQVQRIVDQTLAMTDLTPLAGAIVGEPGGEGLSVEQRKRLSIAVELVADPSVVFMDEPTSGLDARAAAIVMRAVKNVSLSNRTVMVTIHQPSMDIFEAFDNLVLLQRGGHLTYFGKLGEESSMLVSYLQGQPDVEPIKPGYNPATWMLEVTGGSMSTTFKSSGHDFPQLYQESELRRQNEAHMEELAEQGRKTTEPLSLTGTYATSQSTQRKVLLHKFLLIYWRSPNYNFVRAGMTVIIGIILGLVYLNQGDLGDSVQASTVQNIMGLIFVLTIFLGMFNCMTVQPLLGAERTVFYRERSSSYYSPGPYALATGLVEMPYLAAQATVMVCITYWMVGFQALAWKFFYFLLMYFLSLTFFTFMGQCLTFATPNQLLAQLLSGLLNQIFSFFAGFMVPYPSMPQGWKWMNRLSPTTWILYGLAGSQLSDRDNPMNAYGTTTTVSSFMNVVFGYESSMVWWCVLIVLAYCIFFRGLATVMLAKVNFQRR